MTFHGGVLAMNVAASGLVTLSGAGAYGVQRG